MAGKSTPPPNCVHCGSRGTYQMIGLDGTAAGGDFVFLTIHRSGGQSDKHIDLYECSSCHCVQMVARLDD